MIKTTYQIMKTQVYISTCLSIRKRAFSNAYCLSVLKGKKDVQFNLVLFLEPCFHIIVSGVVTVAKIESRSFSSAEIQHFRTENTRSNYN